MKAVITGADGFVGKHLNNRLSKEALDVYPLTRKDVDLRDKDKAYEVINHIRPDYIFHLAASAFVKFSFEDPSYVINNNINSMLNILEAVKNSGSETTI